MKKIFIENNIYLLEFFLTLVILFLLSQGIIAATVLGVLYNVIKKVLVRYELIAPEKEFSGIKTMGAAWSASLVKTLISIIL